MSELESIAHYCGTRATRHRKEDETRPNPQQIVAADILERMAVELLSLVDTDGEQQLMELLRLDDHENEVEVERYVRRKDKVVYDVVWRVGLTIFPKNAPEMLQDIIAELSADT